MRWPIAKFQVHGFLNKSAHVVQIYAFSCILSDSQKSMPTTDASAVSIDQKHISLYLFVLCIYVWHMKLLIPSNIPEITYVQQTMCNRARQLKYKISDK